MHRKLKSIAICGKATIDKWLEISPSWTKSNVRLGSIASFCLSADHFRSSPLSRHVKRLLACLKGANFGSDPLLYDKVCDAKQCCRKLKAECPCGLEVEGQLEAGKLVERNVAGIGALENFTYLVRA